MMATTVVELLLLLWCSLVFAGTPVLSFNSPTLTPRTKAESGVTLPRGRPLHAVRSSIKRVADSLLSRERADDDLREGIAHFYDRSSRLWEEVWGEHMHHGYYVPPDRTD